MQTNITALRTVLALSVALPLAAATAHAVIKIDLPVSRIHKEAAVVSVGAASRVNDDGSVAFTLAEAIKGRLPDAAVVIDVPAELGKRLKTGDPIVVFDYTDRAILHAGDAWYRSIRKPGGRWAIAGPAPMIKNFPGRTVALAAIVRELKAGRPGIQDGIGHEFVGALHDRGNLGVKPTFLTAANVNDDGNLDLLVGTAGGVRLFLAAAGDRYADATEQWGLKDVPARHGAAADVNGDGKTDLLLGKSLWLREGDRFVKSKADLDLSPDDIWAAAMLVDADGDKLIDAVVLTKQGELKLAINPGPQGGPWPVKSVALWNDGRAVLGAVFARDWGDDGAWYVLAVHPADIVRYPVGSASAPASDFKRLTGIALSDYEKIGPTPLAVDLCTGFDYDGNGRTDFLLVTRGGGITLANRGYGAFLINAFMHNQLRSTSDIKPHPKIPKLPFELSPAVCVAPGKKAGRTGKGNAQNLLFLREDGQLFEIVNDRK